MATGLNTRDLLLMEEAGPPPNRRGLLRALVTAPIAALATHRFLLAPAAPIITGLSAEERLEHHMRGVEAAMQDLFPGAQIAVRGNCMDGHHGWYAERLARNENVTACAMVLAGRQHPDGFSGRIVGRL